MAVRIVKTRKVAVTRPPLLRKIAARADFDDVYVRYAFMALETPVSNDRTFRDDLIFCEGRLPLHLSRQK